MISPNRCAAHPEVTMTPIAGTADFFCVECDTRTKSRPPVFAGAHVVLTVRDDQRCGLHPDVDPLSDGTCPACDEFCHKHVGERIMNIRGERVCYRCENEAPRYCDKHPGELLNRLREEPCNRCLREKLEREASVYLCPRHYTKLDKEGRCDVCIVDAAVAQRREPPATSYKTPSCSKHPQAAVWEHAELGFCCAICVEPLGKSALSSSAPEETTIVRTFALYQTLATKTSSMNGNSPIRERVAMAAMGLSGEAGEAIDYIKKVMFHGHDLDKDRLTKEMGDVLWYLSELCECFELKMEDVAAKNIAKLKQRYPQGFSVEASRNRVEK